MAHVYKYYAPTYYSMDALTNEYFWFAKRSILNDPFDINGKIFETFPQFKDMLENKGYNIEAYKKTLEKFAICSFTKRNDNRHFWSLYSDTYKGWCLEFDEDNLVDTARYGIPNVLQDAIYLSSLPDLNNQFENLQIKSYDDGSTVETPISSLLYDERGREQLFTYLLRVKEDEVWSMEEERRLILGNNYLRIHKETDGNGYKIPWQKNALKSIIVGQNISPCNKELIHLIAKERQIKVYEAIPKLVKKVFTVQIEEIY